MPSSDLPGRHFQALDTSGRTLAGLQVLDLLTLEVQALHRKAHPFPGFYFTRLNSNVICPATSIGLFFLLYGLYRHWLAASTVACDKMGSPRIAVAPYTNPSLLIRTCSRTWP